MQMHNMYEDSMALVAEKWASALEQMEEISKDIRSGRAVDYEKIDALRATLTVVGCELSVLGTNRPLPFSSDTRKPSQELQDIIDTFVAREYLDNPEALEKMGLSREDLEEQEDLDITYRIIENVWSSATRSVRVPAALKDDTEFKSLLRYEFLDSCASDYFDVETDDGEFVDSEVEVG